MEPFEALTEQDKDIFTKYIHYFGDATPDAPLDHILRFWNTNKANLFAAFGNKLTLERKVEVEKSHQELFDDWQEAIAQQRDVFQAFIYFQDALEKLSDSVFPAKTLKNILCYSWHYAEYPPEHRLLNSFFTTDNLIDNVYIGDTFNIPTPNGKTLKVQRGCHIMPTLHKIVTTFGLDEEKYETIRLFQSRILQNTHVYGTLCLSIAPIDFISMSDNACNWNSCMSWVDHIGEYRQGTVEMMNSPCVLVAYLKAAEPYHPFEFACCANASERNIAISNKKWRQLVIANSDVILGNRQYPYDNPDLESQVLSWVRSLLGGDERFSTQLTPIWNNGAKDENPGGKDYRFRFETNYMYNDVYNWRNGYLSNTFFNDYPRSFTLDFSGESECINCGELMDVGEDTSWVTCHNCNGAVQCDCCGSYIYSGDDYYSNDLGEVFCESCINESDSVYWCNCCNQPFFEQDMVEIEWKSVDDRYSSYSRACSNCFPPLGEFGPADEDGVYYKENFSDEAKDFVRFVE